VGNPCPPGMSRGQMNKDLINGIHLDKILAKKRGIKGDATRHDPRPGIEEKGKGKTQRQFCGPSINRDASERSRVRNGGRKKETKSVSHKTRNEIIPKGFKSIRVGRGARIKINLGKRRGVNR